MQVSGVANALWRLQARYEEACQQQPLISTIKGGPPKNETNQGNQTMAIFT